MSTDDSKRIGSPRLAWTGATLLVTGLATLGIAASPATSTTTTAPTATPSSSSASVPSSASTTPSTTPSSSSSAATGTTDPDGTPLLGPDGEPLELDEAQQALLSAVQAVPGARTGKALAAPPTAANQTSAMPSAPDDQQCRDALASGGNLPVTSPDGFTTQGSTAVVFGGDWWEDNLLDWRKSLYLNPANNEAWQSLRTICFDVPVKADQRWSSYVSLTWPTSASGRRLTTVVEPIVYVAGNKGQEGPGWTRGFFADNRFVSWKDTPQPIAQFTGKGFQPYAVFMYVQAAQDTVPDIYHSVITYSFVIE